MRARLVREAQDFERGQDPKEALKIGVWKQKAIEKAMAKMATEYGKTFTISDDDPEYFSAGFSHLGNYYGIGLNPDSEGEFDAQFEDGQNPNTDEKECQTIEEAIRALEGWIEYGEENQETEGECPECGEWLNDLEEECPYCEEDEDEDEDEEFNIET